MFSSIQNSLVVLVILLHASETVPPCYLCMKWQLCCYIDPRMFRMFPVEMLNFQTKKYSFQFWVIYVIERLKNFWTIIRVIDAKVVYWKSVFSIWYFIKFWEKSTSQSAKMGFILLHRLKLVSAIFYQISIFSPNDSPWKTMKNVFYFI